MVVGTNLFIARDFFFFQRLSQHPDDPVELYTVIGKQLP